MSGVFLDDFLNILITVICLVALAIPGFLLRKFKVLPDKATKILTAVLLFGGQPMLTFMSFQKTAYNPSVLTNMLIIAGCALCVHLIMIGLVSLIFIKKGSTDKKVNVVKFASVFGNCGFMGLPFLQAMFDTGEVLIYGAVIVAVFNLCSWTLGIFLITGDKKFISLKKAVINPPFIALIISLPLFIILKKPISEIGEGFVNLFFVKLSKSMNLLGDLTTPLSMIILGVRLAEMNFSSLFSEKKVFISTALKLIVMPCVALVPSILFPSLSPIVKCGLFFTFAMPTATQTLLFSEQYGSEPYTASKAVLLNTLISVITIPLVSMLLFTVL